MEALQKIATYIQTLEAKDLQKYILSVLLGVLLVAGVILYYIHQYNIELIGRIKQLRSLTEKSARIIQDNKVMVKEEERLKDLLEKHKDFTMQAFFEKFCRENNIVAEPGWDSRSEPVSDTFDEITLPAQFKGQTTQSIVTILQALEKKEIVYIKELTIRNENNGKITLALTLATKKYKSNVD